MRTEKERLKNSITLSRKVIKLLHEFNDFLQNRRDSRDTKTKEDTQYLINKQEKRVRALETKLGVLVEKGRLG